MNEVKSIQNCSFFRTLALCVGCLYSVFIYADSAQLSNGILTVPHIKVGNQVWSASFEPGTEGVIGSYVVRSAQVATYTDGSSGPVASYSYSSKKIDIPSLLIDGKYYHMTLAPGSTPTSYVIESVGLNVPDWLFMIASGNVKYANSGVYGGQQFDRHFALDLESAAHYFSDRPYRLAHSLDGGLQTFVNNYDDSDFKVDHPNTTFAGTNSEGVLVSTIFELGIPQVIFSTVIFPVDRFIGDEPALVAGDYTGSNFVVDNFWDWLEVLGTDIAAAAACTVGEVATAGLDSPACAGAVVAAVAANGNLINKSVKGE
jgi:hypothetical protein